MEIDDKILETIAINAANHAKGQVRIQKEAYVVQPKSYKQLTDASSKKTKEAHKSLYEGYAKKLTEVSSKIDSATDADTIRNLKIEESFLLNAVYLHELFFSNCFNSTSELYQETLSFIRLQRDWGTFDKWMDEFQKCAAASRNGWVVCAYNTYLKKLQNVCIDSHNVNVPLGTIPIIVIDTWEHSYFADFGIDKEAYVVAMMREIDWDVIEERMSKIDQVNEVLTR